MTNEENTIDIFSLLKNLWSKKILIIILCIIFGSIAFVLNYFFKDYTYTAEGVLYVSNRDDNTVSDNNQTISKTDIDTAKTLSATYIEILKTREFLVEVSEITKDKVNWKTLSSILSVSIVNDTDLIKISVTTNNPDLSFDVAESVIKLAPEKLLSVYDAGKVRVVNKVFYPTEPNSKGTVKVTVIGVFLGLVIGIAYVFVLGLFDTKIHNSAEIVEKYNFSIFGELSNAIVTKERRKNNYESESDKILSKDSNFDTVETYKSIRTNIMFSIPKSPEGKVITVTSPAPSEGKTTTVINLAITFSQKNSRILLIDCDLRRARVHRYLNIDKGAGLTNILCGFCSIENAIQKSVKENLDVLTAGELPPNPAELLDGKEFEKLIDELKKMYDYIFIDTPPVTVVTDATVVMPKSSGVVLVVRENRSTFDLFDKTVNDIQKTQTKILGVIVLDSAEKERSYGYYKKSKYAYNYNYTSNDNKKEIK